MPIEAQLPASDLQRKRILLVDDDEMVRRNLSKVLKLSKFEVVTAASVPQALKLIVSEPFDALLSDLHMPATGDGLTVVSAMRHTQPKAVTLLLSGHPALKEAAAAIELQVDGVLVKSLPPARLVEEVRERILHGARARPAVESVASILERQTQKTIGDWLIRVEAEPDLIAVPMAGYIRTAHLPQLFEDLVHRLRCPLALGTRPLVSEGARAHGTCRRQQRYTAAMLVDESRMLQVSIFQTLQDNLDTVDHNVLLVGVMAIADEVDSQLAQAMASYILESKFDTLPEGTTSA